MAASIGRATAPENPRKPGKPDSLAYNDLWTIGQSLTDRDQVVSDSPTCEIRMAYKGKAFRHDIVLADERTGTILVWK
jgi:hypothetical protein